MSDKTPRIRKRVHPNPAATQAPTKSEKRTNLSISQSWVTCSKTD